MKPSAWLLALFLMSVSAGVGRAGEPPPLATGVLPPALAAEVEAVVRLDDGAWLLQRLDATLGGNGPLPRRARSLVAEALYNLRSVASIDPSRPALLAWRRGDAPLLAVLPVADRRRFLDEFGNLRLLDRLLIRTGEEGGTVVYRQVTPGGTWEYRLLLRDGYAYLARTGAECRALADHGLPVDAVTAPVRMQWRGAFLARDAALPVLPAAADGVLARLRHLVGPLAVAIETGSREVVGQLALVTLTLGDGDDGSVAVRIAALPAADTPLAVWLAQQSNTGSRLLPLVRRPDDVLRVHAAVRWRGELDRLGRSVAAILRDRLGRERFPEERESDLRDYFALLDRQGAVALALGAGRGAGGGVITRLVAEQPEAAQVITLERTIDALDLPEGDELGAFDAVSGLIAYAKSVATGAGPSNILAAAAPDYLLKVAAGDPQVALVEMRTLIAALGETHPLQGAPGVIALRLRLDALINTLEHAAGQARSTQAHLAIDLAVRSDAGRRLQLGVELPLGRIQEALLQSDLVPDPGE